MVSLIYINFIDISHSTGIVKEKTFQPPEKFHISLTIPPCSLRTLFELAGDCEKNTEAGQKIYTLFLYLIYGFYHSPKILSSHFFAFFCNS